MHHVHIPMYQNLFLKLIVLYLEQPKQNSMEPFIGQITMFGGTFAPRGWANCDGQLLAISSNQALFSLLGTTYGGDGRTTFALPDLRGRFPMHAGNGPGLTPRPLGQKSGTETHTILANNVPPVPVTLPATDQDANSDEPSANILAVTDDNMYSTGAANTSLRSGTTGGSATAINHVPPFTVIRYIIALTGTFPSRS